MPAPRPGICLHLSFAIPSTDHEVTQRGQEAQKKLQGAGLCSSYREKGKLVSCPIQMCTQRLPQTHEHKPSKALTSGKETLVFLRTFPPSISS